jgi:hypothetical protein
MRPTEEKATEEKATEEKATEEKDLIDEAERIFDRIRDDPPRYRRHALEDEFGKDSKPNPSIDIKFWFNITEIFRRINIDQAAAALGYISPDARRYYFGRAREYVAQAVVDTKIRRHTPKAEQRARLDVVDLPSFRDTRTRLLALNSVLATTWEEARREWEEAIKQERPDIRVPTFIVVDEAHNLIPFEQQGLAAETLKEQFQTIAAEGRKYGLFLIVCTQRPDKIDPRILSECENKAIMRLGTNSVLEKTQSLLGLEGIDDVKKCLLFQTGRVILSGRWAMGESTVLLYAAMRRTEEGGRSLREKYWATPPEHPSNETSDDIPPIAAKTSGEASTEQPSHDHEPKRPLESTLAERSTLVEKKNRRAVKRSTP